MRILFVAGAIGLAVFEAANVYFIMPMPGSQRLPSIDVAYALYQWRWLARALCGALMLAGLPAAWRVSSWRVGFIPALLLIAGAATYAFNFVMSADHLFQPPKVVAMKSRAENRVALDRLVVGIEIEGDARAYPLQYIGYHHQVRDIVAGQEVLVSYCTVCRTGRVFIPTVNGVSEQFRLVGMDHFNAMLEDATTGSWWRQANGEAITGPRRGTLLPELPSRQVTLATWFALYPHSLVMQGDPAFTEEYAMDYAFERGTSRKALTGTDTTSWGDKSWVVGIALKGSAKAYDWNRLKRERVINDEIAGSPIVLVLAQDSTSFFAFERPDASTRFSVRHDSLIATTDAIAAFALNGKGATGTLRPINASQEFWHSWRAFQPGTATY